MSAPAPAIPPEARSDGAEPASLIDAAQLRDYARYAKGALRRHPIRASLVFILVAGAAALSVWALPHTYHVDSRMLAQPNEVMAALGNPGRTVPGDADMPTRSASDTILQHANLVSLVQQTDLLNEWDLTRAPAVRLKDAVVAWAFGKPTEQDRLEALVGLLEKRIHVTTPDRVIEIDVDWPNAEMAYQIVETAQQNFLETRHAMEVSAISESISIIETHVASARAAVDQADQDLHAAREARAQGRAAELTGRFEPRTSAVPLVSSRPAPADPELTQLRTLIQAKHDAIRDLEAFRRHRVGELQGQLTEMLATFAPAHPAVLTLRQTIEQMQHDSPQLTSLRQEEQQLLAEFIRKGGRDPDAPASAGPTPAPSLEGTLSVRPSHRIAVESPPIPSEASNDHGSPEDVGLAEDQLRMADVKYDDLLGRLDSARIELDTARAAFKYRYSVLVPPEVPKRAAKPNIPLTAAGGLLGGLFLAILAAVVADLREGRLVEHWQVERELGLPILAEVDHL